MTHEPQIGLSRKHARLVLKPWSRPCCHNLGEMVPDLLMFIVKARSHSVPLYRKIARVGSAKTVDNDK